MLATQNTEKPPAERAGSDTSEFRITVLATFAGLILVIVGTVLDKARLEDTGLWLVLGSVGTYITARTYLKGKTVTG